VVAAPLDLDVLAAMSGSGGVPAAQLDPAPWWRCWSPIAADVLAALVAIALVAAVVAELDVERTIAALPLVYINGGARGFLVALDPRELVRGR